MVCNHALAAIAVLFLASLAPVSFAHARQGGDLVVCAVEVTTTFVRTSADYPVELGEMGRDMCLDLTKAVSRGIDGIPSEKTVTFESGDGTSIDDPLMPPASGMLADVVRAAADNVYARYQRGDYRTFQLISRAGDRYVLAVTWEMGGKPTIYYFDMTAATLGYLGK